jgi:hypothetical protein
LRLALDPISFLSLFLSFLLALAACRLFVVQEVLLFFGWPFVVELGSLGFDGTHACRNLHLGTDTLSRLHLDIGLHVGGACNCFPTCAPRLCAAPYFLKRRNNYYCNVHRATEERKQKKTKTNASSTTTTLFMPRYAQLVIGPAGSGKVWH